ncbi:hypothetical protein [Fusibacter bizertensis]
MNGLKTVSFEVLAECIAQASGDSDTFIKLWLERNGNSDSVEITDKGKPCFLIQTKKDASNVKEKWLDAYETELDLKM